MNLLIFGSPIAEFPSLPGITHAYLWVDARPTDKDPDSESNNLLDLLAFCETADSEGVPISIFTQDAGFLTEEVLDFVTAVVMDVNKLNKAQYLSTIEPLTESDSIACIAWDGSDDQYDLLEFFQSRGVTVLDMNDRFTEMQIGETPDLDHLVDVITERVTAEVLKVVRAEVKELMSARRLRRSPLKP